MIPTYYEFIKSIMSNSRYIRNEKELAFLDELMRYALDYVTTIPVGTTYYRAQIAHNESDYTQGYWNDKEGKEEEDIIGKRIHPCDNERLFPLPNLASEGRINPKGISYLYLTDNIESGLIEIQASVGEFITVGKFALTKEVKVIDFTKDAKRDHIFYFDPSKAPTEHKIKNAWYDINSSFSQAVKRSDNQADYIPTQIISEYIKLSGYDGVLFTSSKSDGNNLALFDTASAELVRKKVVNIIGFSCTFEDIPENEPF